MQESLASCIVRCSFGQYVFLSSFRIHIVVTCLLYDTMRLQDLHFQTLFFTAKDDLDMLQ